MKTLYLDCGMGAAGDMLTAALLELLPDRAAFLARLNALGLDGMRFEAEPSVKCGVSGTHMRVTVDGREEESLDVPESGQGHVHEHEHGHGHDHGHGHGHAHGHDHSSLHGIEHLVRDHLNVSERVRNDVMAVYGLIADAESRVHGAPVEQVHFHEVGSMDAVADITAVCLLMEELSPEQVVVSPVHVGSGKVRCAHGILPVPAPATALLLRDVPVYGGSIQGELCTPTGAALLRHFATRFGGMPVMRVTAVGYGMGKKDFEAANCVRAMLGDTEDAPDEILELSCNVDDMTGEKISYAMDRLFEAGALDVYTVPIGMKKGRPGILLRVMCRPDRKEDIVRAVFLHTTTIGLREQRMQRCVLQRELETVQTPLGEIRRKTVRGYGTERSKWEYEDVAAAAKARGISLAEAERILDGKKP